MKKTLLIAIAVFMCIDSSAQVDFPVYQPLPSVQPRRPVPMDNSYPRFDPTPQTSYSQPKEHKLPEKSAKELHEEAQSNRLNRLEGFEDFKFGTSILFLVDRAQRISGLPEFPNLKRLEVRNTEAYKLYGENIKSIILELIDEKLACIVIEFSKYNPETDEDIRIALLGEISNAFGEWSVVSPKVSDARQNVSSVGFILASEKGLMFKRFNSYTDQKTKSQMRRGEILRIFNYEYGGVIKSYFNSGF